MDIDIDNNEYERLNKSQDSDCWNDSTYWSDCSELTSASINTAVIQNKLH